ncbi:MAG: segregation ATPase FtsK/SpoIIIE-like protein [Acidobacteria bacterium]|jgi:S-DNA-T family DNA segregation ATPase FtsK/SpoIIIE|nr:segregation ATPase FtsK/SpoIIIE-like protein [Acidobacteriota bacterium]
MATEIEKKQTSTKNHSRVNEIVAVILLALAVLVFLCLVTHSPTDWSLNTSSSLKTQNWIGVTGAVVADLLFQVIGISAYIFPALLALIAWRVFYSESLLPRVSRLIGFALFVISASSLISLLEWRGGLVGALFSKFFVYLLSPIGAGILLFTFLTASILLLTNFSFFGFFDKLEMPLENLRLRFEERFGKWRVSRRQRQEENRERAESRQSKLDNKPSKASPTISLGETLRAKLNGKTKTAEPSLSLKDEPLINQPGDEIDNFVEPFPEEEIMPTISASEDFAVEPERFNDNSDVPFNVGAAASGQIPITPVQHTGDLTESAPAQQEAVVEKVPELPRKPQTYEDYILPPSEFLTPPQPRVEQKDEDLLSVAQELTEKTKEFNVTGRVVHICQGPVVTTYEFKPDPGVKYSRVTGLVDDLCLALKAESIRIDRIPGKAFVGIEVPNRKRETIQLREVIESKKFKESNSLLSIALGKTIDGLNYVADLAKMPHLLIAGATGAGKSVGVNSLVVSILYKAKPDEVKFIMVDPKRLELGLYADIPHLATPIITDPKRAAISLKWAVSEMEKRYKDLAGWGVRNIDGFNTEVKRRNAAEHFDDNGEPWKTLPYIVIIIDELADLMMVSGKEVEESITRLAQMARAVGIHLVLATQRPSVDVITGLIKANFPARISFRVSSKVDSRTIIDGNGAESLLGKGDMLFLPPATSQLVRVHGAFVDEKEIYQIVEHIKAQGNPEYDTTITKTDEEMDDSGELPGRKDPLFWDAVKSVASAKRASTSLLQRHLRIGYGRAAAILDAMVREGYIGEMDGGSRARPILQKAYDDLQDMEEMNSF